MRSSPATHYRRSISLLCLVVASCTPPPLQSPGAPATQLAGVYWRLTEVEGTPVPPTAAGGREAHLRLVSDGGRLTGFTTCNSVFGRYETPESGRVRFFQLGSTRMACVNAALMRRETQFMAALQSADRYTIAGETLTLFSQGKPVARFVAVR
jgi:heat shock protein HslJ